MSAPACRSGFPKAAVLIEELEKLAKETEFAAGYQRVRTPHIARESMYVTSGHLPYYAESMFPPMRWLEEEEEKAIEKIRELMKPLQEEATEMVSHKDHIASPGYWSKLKDQIATYQKQIDQFGQRYYLKAMNCPHHHKHLCGGTTQLSRPATAAGRIRHLLPLRTKRRAFRPDARAIACK